jgi:hypothetical protein
VGRGKGLLWDWGVAVWATCGLPLSRPVVGVVVVVVGGSGGGSGCADKKLSLAVTGVKTK